MKAVMAVNSLRCDTGGVSGGCDLRKIYKCVLTRVLAEKEIPGQVCTGHTQVTLRTRVSVPVSAPRTLGCGHIGHTPNHRTGDRAGPTLKTGTDRKGRPPCGHR